ncbi:MAG: TerB family tellurite resistance protein [Sphingobacteriaceae bacterium]|nr:TerB family tellurite resistance protein [Sphingobacteriaceae bacterium]
MKHLLIILLALGTFSISRAQSAEVQQLLLNYEKLTQLKNILADMKKGYQIVSKGYNTIKDISEGNFNLHETFINGLMSVSPVIRNYRRVPQIINYQKSIVREYKASFTRYKSKGTFSISEIDYLSAVYNNLLTQSLRNLDELATILTSSKLSMSDDERLTAIDKIFEDTEDKLQFLRDFNSKTDILVIQRLKETRDIEAIQKLHLGNP